MSYPPPPGSEEPPDAAEPGVPAPGLAQPPPHGQPRVPYGEPQVPYRPSAYDPGPAQPSKALAITALVLAVLPLGVTSLISLVLAIVVLAGKKAGRGLAIAALVIDLVVLVLASLLVGAVILFVGTPVDDLKAGQCINAEDLHTDDDLGKIDVVSCGDPHDGEVLATMTLDASDARAYGEITEASLCTSLLEAEGHEPSPDLTLTSITAHAEPEAGDLLACIVSRADGEKLTEKLG